MDGTFIKYPVYIVSKGRWENPITAKMFMREGVPFKIAVEPHEYDNYLVTIPKENMLVLPFSNLGLGSYPARNECWEDSIRNGHKKHLLFDDNIYGFIKFNKGIRYYKKHNNGISAVDAINKLVGFTEKYKNVAISGFNYDSFATKETKYPFVINTHVYSAMLIDNEIPFRWRLKYNEDIDLCLQALSAGYNTILLNAILALKVSTSAKLKGGNQTELYKGNSKEMKILKAKSIQKVWPQYVKVGIRFNRPHHIIDWKSHFKHPLVRIDEAK